MYHERIPRSPAVVLGHPISVLSGRSHDGSRFSRGVLRSLAFEKAFCLYRLNEPKKALEIILACPSPSQKLLELKAQVLYRLERYEECYQTYREIIKQSHDEYEDERLSDLLAVVASLAATQQLTKSETPQQAEHTYELLYNTACRLAAEGQYIEAKVKLLAAEELKPKDVSVIATASNNSVVINRDQNVFDSKKKIRSCTVEILEHKLTSRQRGAIAFTQCLIALYNQQFDYCLQLCDKLLKNFPLMKEGAVLIKSLVLVKDNKVEEAVELLKKFTPEKVDDHLKLKLTAVLLLLSQNDKDGALQLLESLVEFSYQPGIVSALVTLHLSKNKHDEATKLLNKAVDWHTNNKIIDITKQTPTSSQNQVQHHGPRLQQRKLPPKKKKGCR
ncbi:hypothetical protein V9T40_013566 [Parthenolecanium corni]|uniref:Signal recognition particle subunit SRP72 n=1 Tax=Parthenolecanium corni TaxID=536013 RepID=A0AAN9TF87_9HEMI